MQDVFAILIVNRRLLRTPADGELHQPLAVGVYCPELVDLIAPIGRENNLFPVGRPRRRLVVIVILREQQRLPIGLEHQQVAVALFVEFDAHNPVNSGGLEGADIDAPPWLGAYQCQHGDQYHGKQQAQQGSFAACHGCSEGVS
ncbi:hypothetical protein HRbin14_01925 [bacterium HR14]|nr:hypothetical protein HRbin14_01925 [bacterium HR14]